MRTSVPPSAEPGWYVVDATGKVLGRLAAHIAHVLHGKHKPDFSPHMLHGDHVIVVNAGNIVLEGRKREEKFYTRHTGYFGHMKRTPVAHFLASDPGEVITRAVRGMLPRNRLRPRTLARLHVYRDDSHPHTAQKPKPFESLFPTPPFDKAQGKLRPARSSSAS